MTINRKDSARPSSHLVALLDGRVVGAVHRDARARLHFTYEDAWRDAADAYPISLSMPLTAREHKHEQVEAFLWGLLPDNERTLDHYARTFGVSARNPMAILAHIGADCAGAIQFVPPDDVEELEGTPQDAEVEWLTDDEIARELRSVKATGIAGRDRPTLVRVSLAGAQPKIALFRGTDRWGQPQGRTPTTHILKPPSDEFAGFAENEHLCLALAAELGLGAANSEVREFDGEVAIVVQRYDRRLTTTNYRRVHQEDMCQALAVLPWRKYEAEGGPGIAEIVALIQESSGEPEIDVGRFIEMTALNWVLSATDAHAKNFALLHAPGGEVRLAPFYDVASYLPYTDSRLFRVKLAMRIGKEYLVRRVARADWIALAKASRLPAVDVLTRVEALLPRIAAAATSVGERAINRGLDQRTIEPLVQRIIERSRECEECLRMGESTSLA